MRKLILVAMFLFLFPILGACGNNDAKEEEKAAETEKQKEEKTDEQIEVDKGLLNVEVTLPASFFEGQEKDQITAKAKEQGIDDFTVNEDGSVTYKMSKSKHKEMLKEVKATVEETTNEMKNGGDYPSVKDVTYNDDLTEFTMVVDKEAYENSMDAFATFGLGLTGMYYQLFSGVDSDKYKVTINVKDEKTNEVFNTAIYPDDLEEEGEGEKTE